MDDIIIKNKKEEFIEALKSTNRENINNVIDFLEKSDFFYAPASSIYHGNYKGGLLEHSLNVMHIALKLYDDFKEMDLDKVKNIKKENVIIASLLHDICKTYFYVPKVKSRKNENNEWEQYIGYDIEDQLPLWHGAKSVIMLQMAGFNLTIEEMLAIQWHMGAWNGYSDPNTKKSLSDAFNKTPLCLIIHCADSMSTFILENNNFK